jgi:hypothetical protein
MILSAFSLPTYSQELAGKILSCDSEKKYSKAMTLDQLSSRGDSFLGIEFTGERLINARYKEYSKKYFANIYSPYITDSDRNDITDGNFYRKGNGWLRIIYSTSEEEVSILEIDPSCDDNSGLIRDDCSRTYYTISRSTLELTRTRYARHSTGYASQSKYQCKLTTSEKIEREMLDFTKKYYEDRKEIMGKRRL